MTRVLLTGAGGFVGSHVLEALLTDTDWSIVAVDSFRHNGAVDRAEEAIRGAAVAAGASEPWARHTEVLHDLAAPFSSRQLDQIGKLDYIVHVASRCSVPESIEHPADFVRNNIDSTLTVLELARRQWCWAGHYFKLFDHRLVHLSTDEVYGPTSPQDYTDHRPSSPYAASKAAQEDLTHAWCRTYGIPVSIVNSANMFGERQSQLAFIPKVIAAVLSKQRLPIHAWHGAPGTRFYTYVGNTARAIVEHLTSEPDLSYPAGRPLRVPLPGQQKIDNLALALQIASLIGRPLRYELVDGPAARPGYDPSYVSLGGSGIRQKVDGGDWAQVSFTGGLERTVKWFVDHPGWLK